MMAHDEVVTTFGLSPIETIILGDTDIDKNTFHAFLRGIS